jgi:hypothetical protein
MNRVTLCLILICYPFFPSAAMEQLSLQRPGVPKDVSSVIRLQLRIYENAWNQGDISVVVAQYHPSMFAILRSEYLDYTEYIKRVNAMMSAESRERMRLEIHTVRALGKYYAVANGRVHSVSPNGSQQSALFTVIYRRFGDQWKLIYAHS